MEEIILVLTTVPVDFDGSGFARTLVEERLAACVSLLPPQESTYRWQGTIECAAERQVLMKTRAGRFDALRERVLELHPYSVPELVVVPVTDGSAAYLDWIRGATAAPAEGRP